MNKPAINLLTDIHILQQNSIFPRPKNRDFIKRILAIYEITKSILESREFDIDKFHNNITSCHTIVSELLTFKDKMHFINRECNQNLNYFLNEKCDFDEYENDDTKKLTEQLGFIINRYNDDILMIEVLLNIYLIYKNLTRSIRLSDIYCYLDDFFAFLTIVQYDQEKYSYILEGGMKEKT